MLSVEFSDLLSELQGVDWWLREMGFTSENDRFRESISTLRAAAAEYERARKNNDLMKIANAQRYYFGLVDAIDLRDVYIAFRGSAPEVMRPILARAIRGGSILPSETSNNSFGRNAMFELLLAADWKLRGAAVTIGDPDITITCGGETCYVECKRPWAQHSIRANVRGAASQLRDRLSGAAGNRIHGLVSISVSRILNNGQDLLIAESESALDALAAQVRTLYVEQERHWRGASFHPRVVGVQFHASIVAIVKGQVVRAGQSLIGPIGPPTTAYKAIAAELDRLYAHDTIVKAGS